MGPKGQRLIIGLPDAWVSTSHAILRSTPTGWVIEDEKSKNGTLINGRLETHRPLADGDLIDVGHGSFFFREGMPNSEDVPPLLRSGELAQPAFGVPPLRP